MSPRFRVQSASEATEYVFVDVAPPRPPKWMMELHRTWLRWRIEDERSATPTNANPGPLSTQDDV